MPIPKKKPNEKQSNFMIRCVPQLMKEYDKSQAIAICYKSFKGEVELESFNDYPKGARNNAKRAIAFKEKNGSSCGTQVGWTRARQLADGKNITRDTIARMASFKRHQQHKDVPYTEGCGGIMWDAWGGSAGVNWAINKLKEIDKK
tara:strand:+ start:780 stop:1217 length:438 start_codon:yes stop_codon:yes gene_type:complete